MKYEKPVASYGSDPKGCLQPRQGASNIGPGPVVPKGAPPPSSKGSIAYPKPVGK